MADRPRAFLAGALRLAQFLVVGRFDSNRGKITFRYRRFRGASAPSGALKILSTCPGCRLHGHVTADVRGGVARRWDGFRVGDDTGVEPLRSTQRRYWRVMPSG